MLKTMRPNGNQFIRSVGREREPYKSALKKLANVGCMECMQVGVCLYDIFLSLINGRLFF